MDPKPIWVRSDTMLWWIEKNRPHQNSKLLHRRTDEWYIRMCERPARMCHMSDDKLNTCPNNSWDPLHLVNPIQFEQIKKKRCRLHRWSRRLYVLRTQSFVITLHAYTYMMFISDRKLSERSKIYIRFDLGQKIGQTISFSLSPWSRDHLYVVRIWFPNGGPFGQGQELRRREVGQHREARG